MTGGCARRARSRRERAAVPEVQGRRRVGRVAVFRGDAAAGLPEGVRWIALAQLVSFVRPALQAPAGGRVVSATATSLDELIHSASWAPSAAGRLLHATGPDGFSALCGIGSLAVNSARSTDGICRSCLRSVRAAR